MKKPGNGDTEIVGLRLPQVLHPLEIGHLDLPARIERALQKAGHRTLGDLQGMRRSLLLGIRGLGSSSVRHLYELLHPVSRQAGKQLVDQAGQDLSGSDGMARPYDNIPVVKLQLSTRATNALRAAGLATVGEVWRYQNTWLLEELHNVGVKTAAEIEDALHSFWQKGLEQREGERGDIENNLDMPGEAETIAALPIQVFQFTGRARSVVRSADIRTVGELLKVRFGPGLQSLGGVGPSTARYIEEHIEEVLGKISDTAPEEIANAKEPASYSIVQTQGMASESGVHKNDDGCQALPETAVGWWADASEALTERERTILLERYPDCPGEQATLEEIGVKLGVTRERVRQLRNRAVGKLREATQDGTLAALDDELWSAASRSTLFVRNTSTGADPTAYASLISEQRIAVNVLAGDFEAWLDGTCKKTKRVWFRAGLAAEQLEHWARLLSSKVSQAVVIPAPEMTASVQAVPELVAAAAEGVEFISGHFCKHPLSDNRRRAAVAHTLLLRHGRPMAAQRLAWLAQSDGLLTTRATDLLRTLDSPDFSNLFLDCGDYGYAAVRQVNEDSLPSPTFDYLEDVPVQEFRRITGDVDGDRETVAGRLQSILADHGPLKSADLMETFESQAGEDHSKSGAAAMLTILPQFVRLAPGVYGLFEHVRELSPRSSVAEDLLNGTDLYWYVIARYAGEQLNAYALWTPAMEYRWARWALENDGNAELLRSLTAVIQPDTWPVSERTIEAWKRRAADVAEFTLVPTEPGELPLGSIDLWDVLSVAAVARAIGSMNWVRANRIIGKRIDSTTGAGVIAVLVLTGDLKPAEDWRRNHAYRGRSEILGQVRDELISGQLASQQTDVGSLRSRYGEWHFDRRGTGWVQCATLNWPESTESERETGSETDLGNIDEAVALVERQRKLRRHLQVRDTLLAGGTDE